jgi:excisionase family DNA binding protein
MKGIDIENADADTVEPKLSATPPSPGDAEAFITTEELSHRLRCSVGTIQNWRRKGLLPWIASPGRLVLFSWPDVREAMRRRQRGGQQ